VLSLVRFGPGFGNDLAGLPVGQVRQAGEDVSQVGPRINLPAPTALDDRVDNRAVFTGSGIYHEKPVFLSDCGGTNRVLDSVFVDFQSTVVEE
jgi:hypothetical protein